MKDENKTKEQLINELTEMRKRITELERLGTEHKRAEEGLLHERELLDTLMNNIPDSIYFKDNKSRFIRINKAQAEALGISNSHQAIGKTDFDFFAEKHAKEAYEDEQEIIKIGRPLINKIEQDIRPDRWTRWVSTTKVPIVDKKGRAKGIVGISRDITRRKCVEEALTQEHELLQALIDNIPDIIYFKDDKNRFIRVNKAKAEYSNTTPENMIGKTDFDFYPEEEAKKCFADDNQVMESNTPLINRIEKITFSDKREGWLSTTKIPRHNEKDRVIGTMGISRDITERKRAEAKLKQTLVELERSNAELEQFAYVASHDLQEPLRMVSSYLQLLKRRYQGTLDSDADEFIAYAVDGAARMQKMINDLLDYSRVTTRAKPFEPTNCEAVLDRTLDNLRRVIEECGAVVTPDPLPTVTADDVQLVQLFQNLISNAIKFRGEQPPCVYVSAKQKGNEWVFSVRDNGIGIDLEYAKRIFQIFQKLHSRAEYPGTGIGLAICKKIVERHGGRIWVESQPGEGSTFYFTIPIKE